MDSGTSARERHDERLARKRQRGRTRGRADGSRVAAARTRVAAAGPALTPVFAPVTLNRRQALGAAAAAATAGSLSAMGLSGRLGSSEIVSGATVPAAPSGRGGAALTVTTTSPSPTPSPTARASAAAPGVTLPKDLDLEHLLRRVTFGPTAALRGEVDRMGAGAWLGAQLRPGTAADPRGARVDGLYPRLAWSADRVHGMKEQNDDYYRFLYEPALRHLGRAVWSTRQLEEIMVEFWSDHLHVPAPAEKGSWARHRYDADVIRKHAFGRFDDLLVAATLHPAMLNYLDGVRSTRKAPNENHGRELLELHTLGVDGGYTERDIKQAALLLTGWDMDWKSGRTTYEPRRHHVGPVTVVGLRLGNGSAEGGRAEQERFLRLLATRPATARYVCRKLARRFVSDSPSEELVAALAKTYLRNSTAVLPVLRHLFTTEEFAASGGAKLRRPFERVTAMLRTLDLELGTNGGRTREGLQQLYWKLKQLGHAPYDWPTPDGFPDVATSWQSPATALDLINTTSGLVHGWWKDKFALPGPERLLAKPPANRAAAVDLVGRRVLGRLPTAQERRAVTGLLGATRLKSSFSRPGWDRDETVALAALVLFTSPAYLTR